MERARASNKILKAQKRRLDDDKEREGTARRHTNTHSNKQKSSNFILFFVLVCFSNLESKKLKLMGIPTNRDDLEDEAIDFDKWILDVKKKNKKH